MEFTIERYAAVDLEPAAEMLADAFAESALHRAAFGGSCAEQNRLFFRIGLRQMFHGPAFVAKSGHRVCGYIHFRAFPDCLPMPEQLPVLAATALRPMGAAVPQLLRWFSRWCRVDPDHPHLHLGPVGVQPEQQRSGIGSALMRCYLEQLRRDGLAGYLETDSLENVRFYERFGFYVCREESVIGVPNWFMWRPACGAGGFP